MLEGENFGSLDKWYIICQILLANINKQLKIRLHAELPKTSTPFASSLNYF